MGDGWSPLILALTGAFTAVSGYFLAVSGKKESKHQQTIADQVAKDKTELAKTQLALEAYEQVQGMHLGEIQRLHEQNTVLDTLLHNERTRCERERDAASRALIRHREIVVDMVNVLIDHKTGASAHSKDLTAALDNAIDRAQELLGGAPETNA